MQRLTRLQKLSSDELVKKYTRIYERLASKRTEKSFAKMALSVLESELKNRHVKDVLIRTNCTGLGTLADQHQAAKTAISLTLKERISSADELIELARSTLKKITIKA